MNLDIQASTAVDIRMVRVQNLVAHWVLSDPALHSVHWVNPENGAVCLLQVTDSTLPSPNRVVTTGFYPTAECPFPMTVAQVTQREFGAIQAGELALPEGWTLGGAVVFEGHLREH